MAGSCKIVHTATHPRGSAPWARDCISHIALPSILYLLDMYYRGAPQAFLFRAKQGSYSERSSLYGFFASYENIMLALTHWIKLHRWFQGC